MPRYRGYRRYRRYRRYRNQNHGPETYSSNILLAEFMFYNKKKQVMDEKILERLKSKVLIEGRIFWTNKEFAKYGVGFEIFKTGEEIFIDINEYEISFTPKQYNSCKTIYDNTLFFSYKIGDKEETLLNKISLYNYSIVGKLKKVINNYEEFIDYLIETKLLSAMDKYKEHTTLLVNDSKKIFGIEVKVPKYEMRNEVCSTSNIYHIFEVIEKRINDVNYRVAWFTYFSGYIKYYQIRVVSDSEEDYNYIDKNRMYLKTNNERTYYFDTELTQANDKGQVIMNLGLMRLMKNNIDEVLGKQKVISPSIYRFYAERVSRFDESDYRSRLSEKELKILDQYTKLLKQGRQLKIDHTTISNNGLKVDGENFDMTFEKEFLDIEEKLGELLKLIRQQDVRYNFNALYEGILNKSVLKVVHMDNIHYTPYKTFKQAEFSINGMKIEVVKDSNRIKINGIFCRIADVFDILRRAICYNNIDEYNQFIKEVSHIGMEWKKMIAEGIHLEISNPFNRVFSKIGEKEEEHLYLRFSLLWDIEKRSIVYLMINGKQYQIRYKGKFKQEFNRPRQILTMATLKRKLATALEGITDDMIIEIVENGVKEAKIVQARGLELVKNTVKEIKAVEGEIDLRGTKIYGYEFKGRISNAKYFVEKHHLTVYKWMDGSWNRRCVVDDSSKQRIYEDRLANRLVNIYNEPARISTIHG